MMGYHSRAESLFYYFRIEDQVPENHLLRLIDRHVNLEFIRAKLQDSYSDAGRPSIDPELLLRMLLIGYLYGVTSERKLVQEPRMHLAWRWFTGLGFDQEIPHRWGFPCCIWSPLLTCRRHHPGRADGACSLVPLHRRRPSLCNSQVGSCNYCFGSYSAFTHVTACTLAESPCDLLHRKLRQLRCLHYRFDCYRVERTSSRVGVAPARVHRLCTAHCYAN